MKAIVIHAARDLRIEDWDVGEPGPGEVAVRIASGGVCGSDLHYYAHGGFGPITLKEPMILGHEVSGHIAALGSGVSGLTVGQLVAVSPSRPCGTCRFCVEGMQNQCLNMRFYGSAMPFPHIQGAFREILIADAAQCIPADGLTAGEAALAEPFAVTLHAVNLAGPMLGKRVLVTGCGPIGVLSIIAARRAGAAEIVATDIAPAAMSHARNAGADKTIDVTQSADPLAAYSADKGTFDVLFECSGVQSALVGAIAAMRPGGAVVQVGLGGDMTLPMMQLTAKELSLKGSFRFHAEFRLAVQLQQAGLVDLKPLITHSLPMDRAVEAFEIAGDRAQAMKAQISFS